MKFSHKAIRAAMPVFLTIMFVSCGESQENAQQNTINAGMSYHSITDAESLQNSTNDYAPDQSVEKLIKSHDWGWDNKPFLNMHSQGADVVVTIADINMDGEKEIILSSWGTTSMIAVSEVFAVQNSEIVSIGGFYGFIDKLGLADSQSRLQGIPVFMRADGEAVFIQEVEISSGGVSEYIMLETKLNGFTHSPKFSMTYPSDNNNQSYDAYAYYKRMEEFKVYTPEEIRSINYKGELQGQPISKSDYDTLKSDFLSELERVDTILFAGGFSYSLSMSGAVGDEIWEAYESFEA